MVGRSELRKGESVVTGLYQHGFLLWKKSTASGSAGCVEVAREGEMVFIRDSKVPTGPFLTFAGAEWEEFLTAARANQFSI